MLKRTDHPDGPRDLIEAENKRYARVKVIQTVITASKRACAATAWNRRRRWAPTSIPWCDRSDRRTIVRIGPWSKVWLPAGRGLALVAGQTPVSSEIDVGLLGPLEVEVSGTLVRFDGVKQRRLFVVLALRAPGAVSVDELLEALWGDELPYGRVTALQKQISRLRQRLGDGPTVRHQATGTRWTSTHRPSTPTDSRRCWRARAWHAVATIRAGRSRPADGARPVAWGGVGRSSLRRVRPGRDRTPRGAAARGARGAAGGGAGPVGPMRISSVSCRPWSRSIHCASGCGPSRWSRLIAGRQAEALETMRTGRSVGGGAGHRAGTELRRLERMIRTIPISPPIVPAVPSPHRCLRRQRDDWTRGERADVSELLDAPRRPTGHASARAVSARPAWRSRSGGRWRIASGRRGTSQSRRCQGRRRPRAGRRPRWGGGRHCGRAR